MFCTVNWDYTVQLVEYCLYSKCHINMIAFSSLRSKGDLFSLKLIFVFTGTLMDNRLSVLTLFSGGHFIWDSNSLLSAVMQ